VLTSKLRHSRCSFGRAIARRLLARYKGYEMWFRSKPSILLIVKDKGISEEEWESFVLATPGLRINRQTEYVEDRFDTPIKVSLSGLDAEMEIPYGKDVFIKSGDTHYWSRIFCYDKERSAVNFSYEKSLKNPTNIIRVAAVNIASKLQSSIIDDNGKVYNW